jgi:hypothetical protein
VEIHCPARCSRDQNLLNSSGNLHYFVGTGIGGWFAETIHVGNALRFAFERLWDEPIAREVRKQYLHGPCVVKPFVASGKFRKAGYSPSHFWHPLPLFSNSHDNRIGIGDYDDLPHFNRLSPVFAPNRQVWPCSFGQNPSDELNQDLPGLMLRLRGKDEVYSAKVTWHGITALRSSGPPKSWAASS